MARFDEIRKHRPERKSTCSRCNELIAGSIMVQARERIEGKKQPRHIVSEQESYCERHLIEKYKQLRDLL